MHVPVHEDQLLLVQALARHCKRKIELWKDANTCTICSPFFPLTNFNLQPLFLEC